jgi:hypothetical protein
MNREDIIRMALDTGFDADDEITLTSLERFAALVAAAERNRTWTQAHWTEYERSIVAAEREACAKVCEDMRPSQPEFDQRYWQGCTDSATAIRARGEK